MGGNSGSKHVGNGSIRKLEKIFAAQHHAVLYLHNYALQFYSVLHNTMLCFTFIIMLFNFILCCTTPCYALPSYALQYYSKLHNTMLCFTFICSSMVLCAAMLYLYM